MRFCNIEGSFHNIATSIIANGSKSPITTTVTIRFTTLKTSWLSLKKREIGIKKPNAVSIARKAGTAQPCMRRFFLVCLKMIRSWPSFTQIRRVYFSVSLDIRQGHHCTFCATRSCQYASGGVQSWTSWSHWSVSVCRFGWITFKFFPRWKLYGFYPLVNFFVLQSSSLSKFLLSWNPATYPHVHD